MPPRPRAPEPQAALIARMLRLFPRRDPLAAAMAVALATRDAVDLAGLGEQVLGAVARTLFAEAWRSREDEAIEEWRRRDRREVPARTPRAAVLAAQDWVVRFEQANQLPLPLAALLLLAACPDFGRPRSERPRAAPRPATVDDLGYYLAMQAMGHGISWFDSCPEHPAWPREKIEIPRAEFYL